MEDWLKIAIGAGATFVLSVFGPIAWRAYGQYRGLKREIRITQELAISAITKQRDDANQSNSELKRDLRDKQRELEAKDDFSRQDRMHIRLLKNRLNERNIDFDDIEEQVRKFFNGHGNGK